MLLDELVWYYTDLIFFLLSPQLTINNSIMTRMFSSQKVVKCKIIITSVCTSSLVITCDSGGMVLCRERAVRKSKTFVPCYRWRRSKDTVLLISLSLPHCYCYCSHNIPCDYFTPSLFCLIAADLLLGWIIQCIVFVTNVMSSREKLVELEVAHLQCILKPLYLHNLICSEWYDVHKQL